MFIFLLSSSFSILSFQLITLTSSLAEQILGHLFSQVRVCVRFLMVVCNNLSKPRTVKSRCLCDCMCVHAGREFVQH